MIVVTIEMLQLDSYRLMLNSCYGKILLYCNILLYEQVTKLVFILYLIITRKKYSVVMKSFPIIYQILILHIYFILFFYHTNPKKNLNLPKKKRWLKHDYEWKIFFLRIFG